MNNSQILKTWTSNVVDLWNAQGIKLCEGVSSDAINQAEHFLSFKFPKSFRELYKKVNGFKEMDWNENMFCIWPLEMMIEEYKVDRHPGFIGFCDFNVNSHWIGFLKNQPGIFKRYDLQGYSNPENITDHYEEAIEMINSNADEIY